MCHGNCHNTPQERMARMLVQADIHELADKKDYKDSVLSYEKQRKNLAVLKADFDANYEQFEELASERGKRWNLKDIHEKNDALREIQKSMNECLTRMFISTDRALFLQDYVDRTTHPDEKQR